MIRLMFLWAAVVGAAFAQAASTDSQTLQALLDEVRQLRQDLKANAALGQRSQLLISRLQIQQSAVDKAAQRLDEARVKLAQVENEGKDISTMIKYRENQQTNSANPAESAAHAQEITRLKAGLDKLPSLAQERQAAVTTSEDQLRTEQAKLAAIQDELDQIDKALKKP